MTKFLSLFALLFVVNLTSCVDDEYDAPPVEILPDVEANATIANIKALAANNAITEITEDLIVRAIIIADDESGNFFRQIIVQDETGGLAVNIDFVEAHNFFPIGREIFIKCQGLFVDREGDLMELGGFIEIENGAEGLGDIIDVDDHILKGQREQFVTPKVVTIDQFNFSDVNTLIQLEGVEFVNLGETYADAVGRSSQNKDLVNCDGDETIVRSSGFANFAGVTLAQGNGTLTAVLGAFGSTFQLLLRDLNDVQLTGPRCDGGTGSTGNEELMSVADVRSLINIGSAPDNRKIRGIVISDLANGNLTNRNLYIQDETGGIVVRFATAHDFLLNEEIEVVVSNQEISEFNGLMQINNIPNSNAVKIGDGESPEPRPATIAEVLSNSEEWESTLVVIENVTVGGSVLDFLNSLSDGTGSIDMFTSSFAEFVGQPVPSEPVTMVAIVSQFNNAQLLIRNLDDLDGGGSTGGGDPQFIDIEEIRTIWNNGGTSAPNETKIKGVVISDAANGNTTGRNMVVQQGEFGIVVRFEDDHAFQLGEEVEIITSNEELSEFNGLLQVNDVPNSQATSLGIGTMPSARETTIDQLLANFDTWESTLVRLEDVTITGSTTYDGGTTVSDGTNDIDMFTRSAATFSGAALPGGEVTMVAIVSEFNTPQILIRNLDDVEE